MVVLKDIRCVILITVDCLRYDYFTKYASFTNTFFRRYGNIFMNVYTHGVGTPAAFPAIMTSTYPLMYSGYPYLGYTRKTVAETMKLAGFFTIGLAPNPYLSSHFGYNRGFDLYLDYMPVRLVERIVLSAKIGSIARELDLSKYTQLLTPYVKGFILVSMARYIIEKIFRFNANRKIFLWIHFMDLHAPLTPPYIFHQRRNIPLKEFVLSMSTVIPKVHSLFLSNKNKTISHLYSKSLIEIDWYIEAIISILEHVKLLENSLIILTSDHGELLMEDGIYGHPPLHSEYTLHVPLCTYPRVIDSHVHVESLKGLIDLTPSIIKVLGFSSLLRRMPWHGNPLMFSTNEKKYIIAETAHTSFSSNVDKENLKYSIITHSKIITYKPFNDLVIIRDKQTNKIEYISEEDRDENIRKYIYVINNHIKLEKRTQLTEKIRIKKKSVKL